MAKGCLIPQNPDTWTDDHTDTQGLHFLWIYSTDLPAVCRTREHTTQQMSAVYCLWTWCIQPLSGIFCLLFAVNYRVWLKNSPTQKLWFLRNASVFLLNFAYLLLAYLFSSLHISSWCMLYLLYMCQNDGNANFSNEFCNVTNIDFVKELVMSYGLTVMSLWHCILCLPVNKVFSYILQYLKSYLWQLGMQLLLWWNVIQR